MRAGYLSFVKIRQTLLCKITNHATLYQLMALKMAEVSAGEEAAGQLVAAITQLPQETTSNHLPHTLLLDCIACIAVRVCVV